LLRRELDYTQQDNQCFSTVGGYSCSLKSSDGKRCVKNCLSITEADPVEGSSICQKCVAPQKLFLTGPNDYSTNSGCKESLTISE